MDLERNSLKDSSMNEKLDQVKEITNESLVTSSLITSITAESKSPGIQATANLNFQSIRSKERQNKMVTFKAPSELNNDLESRAIQNLLS
jgi:hypothetical protein